jgi:hypothetical protein
MRDGSEQRVQIKGRVCSEKFNPGAKLGRLSRSGECDVVMLALLDDATLELREVWEAPHGAVVAALDFPGSKARNDRRQLSIGSFKKIAERVWNRDD